MNDFGNGMDRNVSSSGTGTFGERLVPTLAPTIAEAEQIQQALRRRVDLSARLTKSPRSVTGLDVSYLSGTDRVAAAAVSMSLPHLEVIDSAVAFGEVIFPYVPGLLAFRELPFLLDVLERLSNRPEILVCDGYGIAHPRRFGLACHVGVLTNLPTFGVAKNVFMSKFSEPAKERGSWSPMVEGDETLGRALRTQASVKPVFVSVGHRIGLDEASDLTLNLCRRYRIPEVIRHADHLSRRALK